jgi:hypothetical protein
MARISPGGSWGAIGVILLFICVICGLDPQITQMSQRWRRLSGAHLGHPRSIGVICGLV